jgi:predicted transcriptional regulator
MTTRLAKAITVLAPNRLEILRAMCGSGPIALREIARRVGRDVKGVHTDVHALLAAGVVDRNEEGFVFPFDAVRVDFTLRAAAQSRHNSPGYEPRFALRRAPCFASDDGDPA